MAVSYTLNPNQVAALRQILTSGKVSKEEGRTLVEAIEIYGKPAWWDGDSIDTGGPAYPLKEALTSNNEGMSFLDAAALAALQGMLASDPVIDRTLVDKSKWAAVAYDFASAMVSEKRNRENAS